MALKFIALITTKLLKYLQKHTASILVICQTSFPLAIYILFLAIIVFPKRLIQLNLMIFQKGLGIGTGKHMAI
ncbi:hypothetical protein DXA13_19060 [Clostridium sp. AM58-1XD]|nr:hypothetical protein DXA13_19060 [Clostridium sp. AM58-1XD]